MTLCPTTEHTSPNEAQGASRNLFTLGCQTPSRVALLALHSWGEQRRPGLGGESVLETAEPVTLWGEDDPGQVLGAGHENRQGGGLEL